MNVNLAKSQIQAALAALGDAPAATADAPWYDPAPEAQLAFCTKVGFDPAYAAGYPGEPTPNAPGTYQKVIAALPADASDDQIKEYHGMGFTRDGRRACWTALMLKVARDKCAELVFATTEAEQDQIAGMGAANLPTETVRILLMGYSAVPQAYYGPLRGNPTIANAANYCVGAAISSASGNQG